MTHTHLVLELGYIHLLIFSKSSRLKRQKSNLCTMSIIEGFEKKGKKKAMKQKPKTRRIIEGFKKKIVACVMC